MNCSHLAFSIQTLAPQFNFPQGPAVELIMLRWLHFIFGIIWIGLLYFFNLVGFPTMKQLDAGVRGKVFPVLMSRAMGWFRWSALITVVVGLRYYFTILSADAHNSGNPALTLRWFGWWLLVWLGAFALIYPFQLPSKGLLDNPWVRTIAIAAIVIAASWIVLYLNGGPAVSNAHLCISVGGGLGLTDVAERLGRGVARAEEADCLDARQRRARHADARRGGAPGALGIPGFTRGLLAVVPHAFFHGRGGTLPVPKQHRELKFPVPFGDLRAS